MYSDADRAIFKYFDGAETIHGDPHALHCRLVVATAGRLNELPRKIHIDLNAATPEQLLEAAQAKETLERVVREVFAMKPFNRKDGTGAQQSHCLAAWRELVMFLNGLKKKDES